MKTKVLTKAEVVSLLREIVEEQGRDKVAKAQYRIGRRPECIVGHVALRLGGQDALMALREGTSAAHNLFVLEPLGLDYRENFEPVMLFQDWQDEGKEWGGIMERLEGLYPEKA